MVRTFDKLVLGLILGASVAGTSGCATTKTSLPLLGDNTNPSGEQAGIASLAANAGKGITGQVKSMGSVVGSALSKTKRAVTQTFSTEKVETNDPTSLASMPTNLGPEIWVTNGQVFEAKGNFAKAMDNYTKALELDPQNEPALLSTARLYGRQGQYEQAVEFFQKALAVNPSASTYNELGLAYKQLGRHDQAAQAIRQAIAADPQDTRYRNNLAAVLVATGRSDEAVAELSKVFPPAVANYNVAYLHYSQQNLAAAQQHLQLALQLDPNLKPARDLMNNIVNSPVTQSALAAAQTAQNLYRTAETLAMPTVPANAAVFQQPSMASAAPAQSASYTMPAPTGPAAASGPQPTTGGAVYSNQPPAAATSPYPAYPSYPASN